MFRLLKLLLLSNLVVIAAFILLPVFLITSDVGMIDSFLDHIFNKNT